MCSIEARRASKDTPRRAPRRRREPKGYWVPIAFLTLSPVLGLLSAFPRALTAVSGHPSLGHGAAVALISIVLAPDLTGILDRAD